MDDIDPFDFLSDAALMEEARERLGREGLEALMGWTDRNTYNVERHSMLKRGRKFSPELRAKLLRGIRSHPRPGEQEPRRDEIIDKLDEVLDRLGSQSRSNPTGARRK